MSSTLAPVKRPQRIATARTEIIYRDSPPTKRTLIVHVHLHGDEAIFDLFPVDFIRHRTEKVFECIDAGGQLPLIAGTDVDLVRAGWTLRYRPLPQEVIFTDLTAQQCVYRGHVCTSTEGYALAVADWLADEDRARLEPLIRAMANKIRDKFNAAR